MWDVLLQASGDKALYIWRPVPPSSAFVAMGMVVTTTEEPPPQDSISCVPRHWVVESTFKPVKVTSRSHLMNDTDSFSELAFLS